jgi:hypothetical protein
MMSRRNEALTIPNLDEHLDGIERHHFGGTCYANNHYLAWLLQRLGFEVTRHGAAMSPPDVHLVSVVERFFDDRSVRYHNLTVTESRPDSSRSITLPSRNALASAIASGIGMALEMVRPALDGLLLDGDIYT